MEDRYHSHSNASRSASSGAISVDEAMGGIEDRTMNGRGALPHEYGQSRTSMSRKGCLAFSRPKST